MRRARCQLVQNLLTGQKWFDEVELSEILVHENLQETEQ